MSRSPNPDRPGQVNRIHRLAFLCLTAFLLLSPAPAHSQGCTQCLDNTAATPPKTQAAYRRAIVLLTITGGGLFLGTLILFKRHR